METHGFMDLNVTANSYFQKTTLSSAAAPEGDLTPIKVPHLRSPSPEFAEEEATVPTPPHLDPSDRMSSGELPQLDPKGIRIKIMESDLDAPQFRKPSLSPNIEHFIYSPQSPVQTRTNLQLFKDELRHIGHRRRSHMIDFHS